MHKFMSTPSNLYDVKSGKALSRRDVDSVDFGVKESAARTLVFMREEETAKRNSFLQFSLDYSPGCILDFRLAPRLDVFYGSRKLSFSAFEEFDIEYFDFFGRIGVDSRDRISEMELYFVEACVYLLSSERYRSRPVVLFFDSDEIMEDCLGYLRHSFYFHLIPARVLNVAEFKSGLLDVKTLRG